MAELNRRPSLARMGELHTNARTHTHISRSAPDSGHIKGQHLQQIGGIGIVYERMTEKEILK